MAKISDAGKGWRVLRYPPRPPYGDWLPPEAIEAYFDLHESAAPDRRIVLERLATREGLRPTVKHLSTLAKAFFSDYYFWQILFGVLADAVLLPYRELHDALPDATALRNEIARNADALAGQIDEYLCLRLDGKVDDWGAEVPHSLADELSALAARLRATRLQRVGFGEAAWSLNNQSSPLRQFVRYVDVILADKDCATAGEIGLLPPTHLGRLAMAALPIHDHDGDVLRRTVENIKNIRKGKG